MELEARTEYSVQRSRDEIKKERLRCYLLWASVAAACVVIAVFATLLAMGA